MINHKSAYIEYFIQPYYGHYIMHMVCSSCFLFENKLTPIETQLKLNIPYITNINITVSIEKDELH